MNGLVGGPLLVGGLGPGPPAPPLKSPVTNATNTLAKRTEILIYPSHTTAIMVRRE